MPLSVLPLCDESQGVAGPYWEDWKGKLYARAAGPEGLATNVVLQWFYPLQPGFFYDLDGDGRTTCLRAPRSRGSTGWPAVRRTARRSTSLTPFAAGRSADPANR